MFNDNDEMVEREEDETPKDENPSELNADKLK